MLLPLAGQAHRQLPAPENKKEGGKPALFLFATPALLTRPAQRNRRITPTIRRNRQRRAVRLRSRRRKLHRQRAASATRQGRTTGVPRCVDRISRSPRPRECRGQRHRRRPRILDRQVRRLIRAVCDRGKSNRRRRYTNIRRRRPAQSHRRIAATIGCNRQRRRKTAHRRR